MNLSDLATASAKLRAHDEAVAAAGRRVARLARATAFVLDAALIGGVCWLHWGTANGLTAWGFACSLAGYSLAVKARTVAGNWLAAREASRLGRDYPVPGSREMARALGLIRDDVQSGPAVAPEKRAN